VELHHFFFELVVDLLEAAHVFCLLQGRGRGEGRGEEARLREGCKARLKGTFSNPQPFKFL
jgi:hypothetical protein